MAAAFRPKVLGNKGRRGSWSKPRRRTMLAGGSPASVLRAGATKRVTRAAGGRGAGAGRGAGGGPPGGGGGGPGGGAGRGPPPPPVRDAPLPIHGAEVAARGHVAGA